MYERRSCVSLLLVFAAWAGPAAADAQVPATLPAAGPSHPASGSRPGTGTDRFRVGERLEYDLYFRRHRAGRGVLEVEGRETVAGIPAYRVVLRVEGGPFFFRIDNRQVSWIALDPYRSLRFEERLREGRRESERTVDLDHPAGTFRVDRPTADGQGSVRTGSLPEGGLDQLAFFYFLRLLPLEVGSRQELHRFYDSEENPLIVSVEGRREVRTPGGTFRTLVVRPIVPGVASLAEDARAEVLLSDDDRRILVQITSRTPMGEVSLRLRDYREGVEVSEALAEADPVHVSEAQGH